MKAYCLDTFALIAYLHDEKSANTVEDILHLAKTKKAHVFMHAINLGELYYVVFKEEGESQADFVYGRIKEFPIQIVDDVSESFLLTAARLKGSHAISYADAFSAALALQKNLTLVTGDPEFKAVEEKKHIKVLWLEQTDKS